MEFIYSVDLNLTDINALITTANIRIREMKDAMERPGVTASDKEFYRGWIKELRIAVDKLEHPNFHQKED